MKLLKRDSAPHARSVRHGDGVFSWRIAATVASSVATAVASVTAIAAIAPAACAWLDGNVIGCPRLADVAGRAHSLDGIFDLSGFRQSIGAGCVRSLVDDSRCRGRSSCLCKMPLDDVFRRADVRPPDCKGFSRFYFCDIQLKLRGFGCVADVVHIERADQHRRRELAVAGLRRAKPKLPVHVLAHGVNVAVLRREKGVVAARYDL